MKKLLHILLACLALGVLFIGPAQAFRIVETEAVGQAISRGAILWDVREGQDYTKGHLLGAVNAGKKICHILRHPATKDYLPLERMSQFLGAWGIDPDKGIVVYGEKASVCPYFVLVTLEFVGAKNVKVYQGGIDDWAAGGRPLSTVPASLTPLAFRSRPNPDVIVSTDEVIRSLKRKDVQILDVRTPMEYAGEDIRALRGGHIPGAVNIPYEMNWVDPQASSKWRLTGERPRKASPSNLWSNSGGFTRSWILTKKS